MRQNLSIYYEDSYNIIILILFVMTGTHLLTQTMKHPSIWNKKLSATGDAPQSFFLSQYCTTYSDKRKRLEQGLTLTFFTYWPKGPPAFRNYWSSKISSGPTISLLFYLNFNLLSGLSTMYCAFIKRKLYYLLNYFNIPFIFSLYFKLLVICFRF